MAHSERAQDGCQQVTDWPREMRFGIPTWPEGEEPPESEPGVEYTCIENTYRCYLTETGQLEKLAQFDEGMARLDEEAAAARTTFYVPG